MSEKTVIGTCTEVVQKPGSEWVEFHVDAGTKYPVRVATKMQPLIELAKAVGSDVATWTYNEVESDKINEKSGKPYINRYLESVEIGGTLIAPSAGASDSEGMTPEKWDAKERRDFRSRAWAQTLATFTHTIRLEEDPLEIFARLQPFQRKVFEDVCGMFAYPEGGEDVPFD